LIDIESSLPPSRSNQDRKLGNRELSWYALGALPGGIGAMGWSYLIFYYNQVLGLSGTMIGAAALAVTVVDAITDPMAGAISDRTQSRFGRRHPYLFATAIPSAITFYLIWAPPTGYPLMGLMTWLLVMHVGKRLIDTFYSVPYAALGAEISSDYDERTRIATRRSVYFHIGRAVSGGLLLLFFLRPTEAFPNGQMNAEGYVQFGACFGLVIGVALVASAWKTRHWVSELSAAPVEDSQPLTHLWNDFFEMLHYRAYRAMLFGSLSRHIAWGMSDSLGIYMATYFWQVGTEKLFVWGVGMFVGLFVGLPFWRKMATRIDKKSICMIGDATYFLFFCLPYLFKIVGFWPDYESAFYFPLYVLTTGFLAHFGIAASGVVASAMLGDITDLDEFESGRRREGVVFGAESFTWKALTGLGPLVSGLVIDLVGLGGSVDPADIPGSVVTGLGLAQGGVMALLFGLALIFISRYDLSRERHAQVLDALRTRTRSSSE
jgi:GPH family glycoside/pentoside/hexuronide:cation symporter